MARVKSEKLFREASKVLVGGVNSPVRAFKAVGGAPVFIRSGKGARLTTEDGGRLIDYCLSWGPLILGHAHPKVAAAAAAAVKRGSSFGAPTEAETRLARMICGAFPSIELMRLTSSGTESVMSALRVARAFAKRDMIVKFAGCYHGHADSLLVQAGSGAATLGSPDSAGVPKAWAETTINLPYNDASAAAEAFLKWGERIAAVIVEPVAANMGVVPPEAGFLERLREITKRHGALLIFDEVVTGFRLSWGGAQKLRGIRPDLTILGKIMGGGFPLAAYGGRRDVMSLVSPLGRVYQAGTLSGNPVAVAAGLAALEALKSGKPYARLDRLAADLAGGITREAKRANVPLRVQRAGSMFTVFFTVSPVKDYESAKWADTAKYAKFFNILLEEGIYFPPSQFEAAFLSTAHTEKDIEKTLSAVRGALERL